MAAEVKTIDRGWNRIRRLFQKEFGGGAQGPVLKVGIQGNQASAAHEGGITNVGLAVVHEFGASIAHPGGTPYAVASMGGSSRSGGMVGSGAVTFVRKGSPDAIGVTRAHRINIPERSFIRAPFAKNTKKYWRMLEKGSGKAYEGKITLEQILGLIGVKAVADMQNAMARGIPPPIKAATIRARKKRFGKASTKPLIATGQLRQSITWAISKK